RPSDGRLRRSGIAVSTPRPLTATIRGMTRAERLEALGRPLRGVDDLRIAFPPGPGTDDVSRCEDRHARELHESSSASSLRRRSDEMPALPAVRPVRPPAAI